MGRHLRPIVRHGMQICLDTRAVTYQWFLCAPFGFRRSGTISFASFSRVFQVLRKASMACPVGRESRATGGNNQNFEFLLTKKQEQYPSCSCHWRIGCLQAGAMRKVLIAQFQLAGAVGRKSRATELTTTTTTTGNQSRRNMRNGAQFKFCSGTVGVRKHGSEVCWS